MKLGSPKVVELLIKSGANVDLSSDFGVTPLILASSRGNFGRAKIN